MDDETHPHRLALAGATYAGSTAADGPTSEASDAEVVRFAELFGRLAANIGKALRGKTDQVNLALLALVSEGHLLLEDVPGVGKTSLARAIAESIEGSWRRVQFTPDLLPSDVTGISIWDPKASSFDFRPGPVFANVVIGDEINRASPKTQSALLEVMEERQVTVDGESRRVPRPFIVIATQNPIEMEGTYNLPEAQLDRFMLKMSMGYPDLTAECDIVHGRFGGPPPELDPVVSLAEVDAMVHLTSRIRLDGQLVQYAVSLVQATRQHPHVRIGASPRGSLGLLRCAQSLAAAEARSFVTADDVKRLAQPILGHRLILAPEAQLRGVTSDSILAELLQKAVVPGGRAA